MDIPVDDFAEEPVLTLTLSEVKILTSHPFLGYGSEKNYPGFNDIVKKLFKFAEEHELAS